MVKGEVVGVQYLRGHAAALVVFYHVAQMVAFPKYFGQTLHSAVLDYGSIGVDIFFVISGFIITVVTLDRDFRAKGTFRAFALKRGTRILPLMWLAILSYALLRTLAARAEFDVAPYIRAMMLFPSGQVTPNVIWTLRHELIFYMVFAISVFGARGLRLLLPLWVLSPIIIALLGLGDAAFYADNSFARIMFNPVDLQFGAGLVLGLIWLRMPRRPLIQIPILAPLIVVGALCVGLALILAAIGQEAHHTAMQGLRTALLSVPVVAFAIYVRCPEGFLDRAGRLVGAASYSIYLFHEHVVSAILGLWRRVLPGTPVALVIAGAACAAVAVGILVHLLVERRLVAGAQAILIGRTAKSLAAPAPIA